MSDGINDALPCCPLCHGSGEVEIEVNGERDCFGCPKCIAVEKDAELALAQQHLAASEQQLNRCAVAARSYREAVDMGESFGDALKAVLTLRQNADAGFERLAAAEVREKELREEIEQKNAYWKIAQKLYQKSETTLQAEIEANASLRAQLAETQATLQSVQDQRNSLDGRVQDLEHRLEAAQRPVTPMEWSLSCLHFGKAANGIDIVNHLMGARAAKGGSNAEAQIEAAKPVTDEERERWYRVGFEDCRAQSLHAVDEHEGYLSRIGSLEPTLTEMAARAAKGGE